MAGIQLGRNDGFTGIIDCPAQRSLAVALKITLRNTGWQVGVGPQLITSTGYPTATGNDTSGNLAFGTSSANAGAIQFVTGNLSGEIQFTGDVRVDATSPTDTTSQYQAITPPLPPTFSNVRGTLTTIANSTLNTGTGCAIIWPVLIKQMGMQQVFGDNNEVSNNNLWKGSGSLVIVGQPSVSWNGTTWTYTGGAWSSTLTYESTATRRDPQLLEPGFAERWLLPCIPANESATISAFLSAHPGHGTYYKLRPYTFSRLADEVGVLTLEWASNDTKDDIERPGTWVRSDTYNLTSEGQQVSLFNTTGSFPSPTLPGGFQLQLHSQEVRTINSFESQVTFRFKLLTPLQEQLYPHVRIEHDPQDFHSQTTTASFYNATGSAPTHTYSDPRLKTAATNDIPITPAQSMRISIGRNRDSADEIKYGGAGTSYVVDNTGIDPSGRITVVDDYTGSGFTGLPATPAAPGSDVVLADVQVAIQTDFRRATHFNFGQTNAQKVVASHTLYERSVREADRNLVSVTGITAGTLYDLANTNRSNNATTLGFMGNKVHWLNVQTGAYEIIEHWENPGIIVREHKSETPRMMMQENQGGTVNVYVGNVVKRGNQVWAELLPFQTYAPLRRFTVYIYKLGTQMPDYLTMSGYTNSDTFLGFTAGQAVYESPSSEARIDLSSTRSFFAAYDFSNDWAGNFIRLLRPGWLQLPTSTTISTGNAYSFQPLTAVGISTASMMLRSTTFAHFLTNTV